MAIVKSGNMVGQVGKLGQNVYYDVSGETRSRSLAGSVSNPRTQSQMGQRVRWANLVNLYRANASWMKYAYETRKKNQSEYNKFMSLNVSTSPVYLTKQLASVGACIVYPYTMTQGSLPSIEVVKLSGYWQTNIYLPTTFTLNDSTTIAAFSEALLQYNPAIREGYQISFIRETQQTNGVTGAPYVVVRKYEMLVNSTDNRLVGSFLPLGYIASRTVGSQAFLAVIDSGQAGGFLLVLSHTVGGRTYVSTQSIILANMDAILAQYTSSAAMQEAIDSYGQSEEPFLTSNSASQPSTAPAPNSIVSVQVDDLVFIPGRRYDNNPDWHGGQMEISFSQALTGSSAVVVGMFRTENNVYMGSDPQTGSISQNKVTINSLNTDWDSSSNNLLSYISVTIDGIEYRAVYDDSLQNLE